MASSKITSVDPETVGFDRSAGNKWIYPENYSRREYQFTIVKTALFNNTLVCLPTGLGKTFIAAVVMYNFWRWYPMGRVVFLAPTKPLVAQQINACHDIMGIPSDQTIELTGAVVQAKRKQAWKQFRVIFATPQTFQKDIQNDSVPFDLIKCVVIDEAHKALGKHSYCEIVRMLNEKSKFFRVLALSATPGSKIDHVREVIQNLLISELELRDDTSSDIIPYTNNRSMEKIIVSLGKDLEEYKERYVSIMDPHVRVLIKNHILQGSTANISKGRIFMIMKQYESRPQKANNHGTIMKTLNILLTMYHAYELLIKHGLRAFYNFYISHSDKFWIDSELELKLLLENVKHYIGDFPVIQPSPDGTIPDVPDNLVFGHNKFNKLRELLEEHFRLFASQNKSTRAIVFVEYRDIVNELYVLLLQKRPLIRPQMFVGQAGQKQKEQLAALEDFRNNQVNVLISTSVGEEGLDVGEVDLIVCFDISSSTPTRLVQRMGRTGRKRSGRVVLLLTEGKEVQTLQQAMMKKDSLNTKILESSNIASSLYQSSPRMVPSDITPECYAMFIKTLPKTPKPKLGGRGGKKTGQSETSGRKQTKRKKKDASPELEMMEPQPSTSKTQSSPKKSGSVQSSMMRFLSSQSTCQQQQQQQQQPRRPAVASTSSTDSDSGIVSQDSRSVDPYAFLRPSDVKLLTSDELAHEFLTLCAMKRSEPTSEEPLVLESAQWLPDRQLVDPEENPFAELSVPPLACLDDCISKLTICEQLQPRLHSDPLEDLGYDCLYEDGEPSEAQAEPAPADGADRTGEEELLDPEGFYDCGRAVPLEDGCIEVLESKYARRSRQLSPARAEPSAGEAPSPCDTTAGGACVEVDFEDILDEATEVSSTSSQLSSDQKTRDEALVSDSLFENLLEEDTSGDGIDEEEDLFAGLSQASVLAAEETLQPDSQADETLRPLELQQSAKRCASQSPCRGSPSKRQRLLHHQPGESSDGDAVLGTPPKPRSRLERSLLELSTRQPSPKPEDRDRARSPVVYPDSDQDLFDDLDFETQFVPDKANEDLDDDKDATFFEPSENEDELAHSNNAKEVTAGHESSLAEVKKEEKAQQKEPPGTNQIKDEHRIESNRIECATDKIISSSKNVLQKVDCNLEFEDWDNFDTTACIVSKTAQEKVSSFFTPKTKSTPTSTTTLRDMSKPSANQRVASSTGWISTGGQSKKISPLTQPKKQLSLKNLMVNRESESKLKDKQRESDDKPRPSSNETHHVYRLDNLTRPNLNMLNLKKSSPVFESKDKDGFALPQQPVSRLEKENKLPQLAGLTRRKDNSVSPRFRRYHSESCLYSPKSDVVGKRKKLKSRRKAGRRRLANEFIEEEAEVSSDCDTSAGSSGDDDDNQHDLSNFVSYTQVHDDEDMQAHYLQTMNRSPIRPGAFLIKETKKPPPTIQLYSQPVSQMEDTYMHDSFCIGDETQQAEHESEDSENDTTIEDLDFNFEDRRQRLVKKRTLLFENFKNKRKQVKLGKESNNKSKSTNNSSSSEDEIELMRKQIMEESMLLKKSKR